MKRKLTEREEFVRECDNETDRIPDCRFYDKDGGCSWDNNFNSLPLKIGCERMKEWIEEQGDTKNKRGVPERG